MVFLYELHVAKPARKRGVARSLLDLVERSSPSRGRSRPTVELQKDSELGHTRYRSQVPKPP